MTDETPEPALHNLLASRNVGVLATIRRDGRPQQSVVSYHYDPKRRLVRVSTRAPLAKTANLRRDPRPSLLATSPDGWSYAVADGRATLGAAARDEHDATVEALITLYRDIRGGDHPDWDDYRRAMVADERLVLSIEVDRVYGLVR